MIMTSSRRAPQGRELTEVTGRLPHGSVPSGLHDPNNSHRCVDEFGDAADQVSKPPDLGSRESTASQAPSGSRLLPTAEPGNSKPPACLAS